MKDSEPLDEVRRAVSAADSPLDEVARARVQARLLAALEAAPRAREPRPTPRWRWGWVVACAVAGGAAAVVLSARELRRKEPAATVAPLASAAPGSFTRLEVPAGARVRTSLGDRARITLAGPAELELVSTSAELLEIRLPRGVLIGDYDHGKGGTLRIQSPGATTEVVGTLFAVEASAQGSRVSVAHGRVQVRAAGRGMHVVDGGQSWSSDTPTIAPIAPETQRLIDGRDAIEVVDAKAAAVPAPPLPPQAPSAQPSQRPAAEVVRTAAAEAPRPIAARSSALRAHAYAPPSESPPPPATPAPASAPALLPPPASAPPLAPPSASAPALAPPPASTPALLPPPPSRPPLAPAPAGLPSPSTPNRASEADAQALYAAAEAAMQSGDLGAARAALERLVRSEPGSRLAGPGRYELARLALRAGDHALAARTLDELIGGARDESLRDPARFLRCRVELAAGRQQSGDDCLARFLQDFPASPHAATARRLLGRPSP